MNLKRGFRRIVLVLSILVALPITVLCFSTVLGVWESEQKAYNDSKNDYENITQWWLVWDADGWIGGKHKAIKTLLSESPLFDFGNDKTVILYSFQVFPYIPKDIVDMPLDDLDREAQMAKEKAIKNAKDNVESHEYWGSKSETEAILTSGVAALAGAGLGCLGAYFVIWFGCMAIYKFILWLISGFQDA